MRDRGTFSPRKVQEILVIVRTWLYQAELDPVVAEEASLSRPLSPAQAPRKCREWILAARRPEEPDRVAGGYCQVDEKPVDQPPRCWARARHEPAMLGIRNGRQPQLDNTQRIAFTIQTGPGDRPPAPPPVRVQSTARPPVIWTAPEDDLS